MPNPSYSFDASPGRSRSFGARPGSLEHYPAGFSRKDGMKIINPALVASFKGRLCEYCRQSRNTTAHHEHTRGSGGSDVRWNLISLCRPAFDRDSSAGCHRMRHDGHISHEEIRALIAKREGVDDPEKIDEFCYWLKRQPKELLT